MLNEFINEIKELQKYKEKYLYAEKDKERMSDLLYEYMMREYKRMSKQKRIEKYEEECCKCCRYREYCNFDFPQNIYQPIQSNNAWIPGSVGCGKFEWS